MKTILHLGLGFFHRAHQAVYLNNLNALEEKDNQWRLVGANIRNDNSQVAELLKEAGGSYTLETVNPQGKRTYQTINSIQHVISYDVAGKELLEYATDRETRIISFTVTEAGYYLDLADNLDMVSDLEEDVALCQKGAMGRTIYGAIYGILKQRMEKSVPITLMCCDNLRHNGARFKHGLLQFIKLLKDDDLLHWIKANVRFPNCMVDRITPRPPEGLAKRVLAETGKEDKNAIMGEEFIQWVLEDDLKDTFIAGRPTWEKVGVEVVTDVAPYEDAKLKVLNATHSCVAWVGTLKGYDYIHEGSQDEEVRKIAYDYMTDDLIPTLEPSPVDLYKYRDVVLDRFSNPDIQDTNGRVAMDSFSKIPGFIVPTIRERLEKNLGIEKVIMLPALFLVFMQQWAEGKVKYEYHDQAMDSQVAKDICASDDPVLSFANNATLWGDLTNHDEVIKQLRLACAKIKSMVRI